MTWLFASGHAVDIVMLVIALEFAWLSIVAGWRPLDALLLLTPGALILLALRAALTGAEWHWVAMFLLLSFPVHLADVRRRRGT